MDPPQITGLTQYELVGCGSSSHLAYLHGLFTSWGLGIRRRPARYQKKAWNLRCRIEAGCISLVVCHVVIIRHPLVSTINCDVREVVSCDESDRPEKHTCMIFAIIHERSSLSLVEYGRLSRFSWDLSEREGHTQTDTSD